MLVDGADLAPVALPERPVEQPTGVRQLHAPGGLFGPDVGRRVVAVELGELGRDPRPDRRGLVAAVGGEPPLVTRGGHVGVGEQLVVAGLGGLDHHVALGLAVADEDKVERHGHANVLSSVVSG